jgi:hypothetical protein
MVTEVGSISSDVEGAVGMAFKMKQYRSKTIQGFTEIILSKNIKKMKTTNFFSSVAAMNITGDVQLTIRERVEDNRTLSVISQSITTTFLSP